MTNYQPFSERIERQLGELSAKVELILKKIEGIENSLSETRETTIRNEENIKELRKLLNDHLHEHEREQGWRVQMKAAVMGGLAGAVAGFFLSMVF